MWTRTLSSLPAYSSTGPVIAVNQSEENSCADWLGESDYVNNEGTRSKGKDENGAVTSGSASEGEFSEIEGVFSSDEDDVGDEEIKPGRKEDGEVSIAKSYSHILKARVSSQENEQSKEKEESNKERGHMGRGKRLCPVPCCKKVVVHLPRSHEYKSLLNKTLQKGKMPYAVQLIDKRATGEKLINFERATLECSKESSFQERQEVEMEQFEVLENEEEEIVTDEDGEVADVEADVYTVPG